MNIYWTFDTHRQEKRTLTIEGEKSIQKGKFRYKTLLKSPPNRVFLLKATVIVFYVFVTAAQLNTFCLGKSKSYEDKPANPQHLFLGLGDFKEIWDLSPRAALAFSHHGDFVCDSLSTQQKVNDFLGWYTVHVPVNQIIFGFGEITGVHSQDTGIHPNTGKQQAGLDTQVLLCKRSYSE